MTRSSSRIDPAARRLLSSIAGTRYGRVSAMALAHRRGAGRQLIDADLLVRRGSTMASVADDDLDDSPVTVMAHPATGHHGHLGNTVWQDEEDSALRRVYALDMMVTARGARMVKTSKRKAGLRVPIDGSAGIIHRDCRLTEWSACGWSRCFFLSMVPI